MSMRSVSWVLMAVLCVSAASTSVADDRFGIGIKAGTYGLGADFGVTLIDQVSLRLTFQRASLSLTETVEEIDYDGDFTLGGEGILADIYPFGGQFRFTAGIYNNRNQVDLAGTPNEPVDIGDTEYPPSAIGTLSGTVDFNDTAPYLGVGWGNTSRGKKRLRFVLDAGILFSGSASIDNLTASAGGVSQEDLDKEAAKIEDDISDADFWPIPPDCPAGWRTSEPVSVPGRSPARRPRPSRSRSRRRDR